MQNEEIVYKVRDDHIEFIDYKYKCSSVCKNNRLYPADIIDVAELPFYPHIRTASNELILMQCDAEKGKGGEYDKLPSFFADNEIRVREAADIWGMILEPFVDTEHSDSYLREIIDTLEKHGISRKEVSSIRREVRARMLAFNFESGLWEWVHLGLDDVLDASMGKISGEMHWLPDADFEKFYWRAMEIAIKGFV